MATWPIGKLLFSMGIPAVFSMLIQAMYNIVDTIYVSQYSQDAMFAIGLASPLQMVGLALALGGSIGVGALLSRRLGEGNHEEANMVATTGVILTFIHIGIVMLIGIFLTKPFLAIFTSRPDIIDLGNRYLSIVLILCFGQFFAILFERLLQAQGNMLFPMFAQLIGAITNIILDPIFIFGFGPIPSLGIAGAAIATVIGQMASMVFIVYITFSRRHDVEYCFKKVKFDAARIKAIYSVGLPTAVMNMIGSLTTTSMNGILVQFTEDAVTSLSVYFRLQSFVFMPLFGFNQGALPILSYNFGAQNKKRYMETVKIYVLMALSCMTVGFIIFRFFPDLLLSFFDMNESLHSIAIVTLSTIAFSFFPAAIGIPITTVFQSFGQGTMSMIQSVLRQLGILIPSAYLLSRLGLDAVWYAYVIAESVTLIIYLPLTIRAFKKNFRS